MLLAAFTVVQVGIAAQDVPPQATGIATAADATAFEMFEPKDTLLSLSAGTCFGLGIYNPITSEFQKANLKPGMLIGLSYLNFLSNTWAVGGEISGIFLASSTDRNFFMMPIAAKVVYAIDYKSFFFTPSVSLGIAITSLSELRHVDPYVNIGSGFAWRPNTGVSYAIKLGVGVIPQLYQDTARNRLGFFMDAAISATYHL